MSKTLPYDALLAMDEAAICEVFPLGAVEWKGRWRPAREGQKADRELAKLLKDKKARRERPRYVSQSGPPRLRWDTRLKRWVPKAFSGDEEHGYTTNPHKALDKDKRMGALEYVDEVTQRWITKEARRRFLADNEDEAIEWQMSAISTKLLKVQRDGIKHGIDLGPALVALIKEHQREIQRCKQEKRAA